MEARKLFQEQAEKTKGLMLKGRERKLNRDTMDRSKFSRLIAKPQLTDNSSVPGTVKISNMNSSVWAKTKGDQKIN
jgi:hypothetical protein